MISIGVGLFVYNRPQHTRIVLEALRANGVGKLFVFADGAKDALAMPAVLETRQLIRSIDWCRTEVVEHPVNMGILKSLVAGIGHMMREHDAAIIVEDDCELRPDAYRFLSSCLDFYKDDGKAFHVNGYQLPVPVTDGASDVYRSPLAMSWGWGLWKRSWAHFRLEVKDAEGYFNSPQGSSLLDVAPDFAQRMRRLLKGEVDSFIYRWNFIINKDGGYCIAPYRGFVRNIGWDGKGVHCGRSKRYDMPVKDWERPLLGPLGPRLPLDLQRDPSMDRKVRAFYRKKPEFLVKIYRRWKAFYAAKH